MARIKIISCAEVHELPVSNGSQSAVIPIDGDFHEIPDALVPVLVDSAVTFECEGEAEAVEPEPTEEAPEQPAQADEIENADATGGSAAAGGAEGLGGSSAPPTDADGDGHDDANGQFVAGNSEAPKAPRKPRAPKKPSAKKSK